MRSKIIIAIIFIFAATSTTFAQRHENKGHKRESAANAHFSPEEFRQKLERFVIKHAELTDDEAKKYFPLHFEMCNKLRDINEEMRKLKRNIKKDTTEKEAAHAIERLLELREKELQIQREYFKVMQTKISAVKLMKAIKAEDKFHREIFRPQGKKP